MTTHWDTDNHSLKTKRKGNTATVTEGQGYRYPGRKSVVLENTGNGYIARFPAYGCSDQDYYVCLDYGQAYDLMLALSEFKKELGFV